MTTALSPQNISNKVISIFSYQKKYNPEHANIESIKQSLINHSLNNLPNMQKKAISLIDIFGLNYQECCKALNITETQLQGYLKDGRQSLLKQLQSIL